MIAPSMDEYLRYFVLFRVTVGVVIGVADLIQPETNIGEVG